MPVAVCTQPVPRHLREPAPSALLAAHLCFGQPEQLSRAAQPGKGAAVRKPQARHLPWLCLDSGGRQNPQRGFISSHCSVGVHGGLGLSSGALQVSSFWKGICARAVAGTRFQVMEMSHQWLERGLGKPGAARHPLPRVTCFGHKEPRIG